MNVNNKTVYGVAQARWTTGLQSITFSLNIDYENFDLLSTFQYKQEAFEYFHNRFTGQNDIPIILVRLDNNMILASSHEIVLEGK